MVQVVFSEVRVPGCADTPIMVLREIGGRRELGIWITATAGAAILSALEADDPEHPSTHDLLLDALATQDAVVESVRILDESDGVFAAVMVVNGSHVTCRPSDGVALALRCGAPILVDDAVFDRLAIMVDEGDELAAHEAAEVAEFREFLSNVSPDDFSDGGTASQG